jgi:hypothetical protein
MPKITSELPEWEEVLSAAAHLQRILPDVVLVGGTAAAISALRSFDNIYPQPNEESALQQLQIQLATPLPYDLDEVNLSEYKHLSPRWHDWSVVQSACSACATLIFDRIIGSEDTGKA